MNEKGRVKDVIVDFNFYRDDTGIKSKGHHLTVWADAGLTDIIKSVEGVTNVYCTLTPTEYSVFLDKRYNIDFVAAEIEAAILIGNPTSYDGKKEQ